MNRLHSKYNIILSAASLMFVLCLFADPSVAKEIRKYNTVEFRGLKYYGKYDILGNVSFSVGSKGIIIDINDLRAALRKSDLIKKHSIHEKNGSLVVTVLENEPVFILALAGSKRTIVFEIDERLEVLSVHKVHLREQPLVLVSKRDVNSGRLSGRLVDFLRNLQSLREDNLRFFNEIAYLDFTGYPEIMVRLKNRPTSFYLDLEKAGLYSLEHMTGYMDHRRRYPRRVYFHSDFAVMK